MAKEEYIVNNIYQGGTDSFEPSQNLSPQEHYISAGSLGLCTDPRSANVLKEVSAKLSAGVKQIEIEGVSPEVFESMPQDQLKEVKRLGKLTGVGMSVHGPVVDSTGITQQGFSEQNRKVSERRFIQTIERSHDLDPEGNIIVNFHSAEGIPGTEWEITPEGKKEKRLIVVDRETGKLAPLEPERKYYPRMKELKKGEFLSPQRRLGILNHTGWDNSISQIIFNKERADEILEKNIVPIQHIIEDSNKGNLSDETLKKFPEQRKAMSHYKNAEAYLDDTHMQLQNLFSKAYEFGSQKQKHVLKAISDNFKKELNEDPSVVGQSRAMQTLLQDLKHPEMAPEMNVPIEKFAVKQSSKTFGNTAFESYKKFGKTAPIISIENPPAGFALSTGEDLKNLIEESRNHFVERAKKEGMSESEARTQSEKLIGATWDVGHINMLRKHGYGEKELIKETEKIKPLVKHVHLSDNFGFEHTELPMGMGNVPIKEIMAKLGKEGFEAKKIIEAGNWWQHFQTPPVKETMEAFGSPLYSMHMAPYWDQAMGLQQDYFSGYGQMLPEGHYKTWGSGFSMASLPTELGGQMPGAQGSRMSGRGME